MAKDPKPDIEAILADIEKKHGVACGSVNEIVKPVVGLTTGDLQIDHITGVGGIPQSRITQLYGPPSCGKTTTALQAAVDYQRRIIESKINDRIVYFDFEQAFDVDYAASLGLDIDHPSFILSQPTWLEQGADIAIRLINTGLVRMSIFDSVAAMTPKALAEAGFDARTAAMERARLVGGFCRYLVPLLKDKHCCAIMINHLMESIEMSGRPGLPPKSTTPGGKGLKFYASLCLEYKQIGNNKSKGFDALTNEVGDVTTSTKVKVVATKNKVGPPFRTAEVRIRYGKGFDNAWSALQVLLNHKRVMKEGAWYRFDQHKVPALVHPEMPVSGTGRASLQGEATVLAFADSHPDWRDALIKEATSLLDALGTGLPGTVVDDEDDENPFGPPVDFGATA